VLVASINTQFLWRFDPQAYQRYPLHRSVPNCKYQVRFALLQKHLQLMSGFA